MRSAAANIRTFLLALVLGIAVWVSAVSAANPNEVHAYPKSVPIEIIGQDSSLVLTSKVPENLDVSIRAPQSVWELLNTQDNAVRAILDLTGLSAGEHRVNIQIQVSLRPTQIVHANPTSVAVNLEPVASRTLSVNHSLSGQPAAGYQAGTAVWASDEVSISGPESLVKQAAHANAVISLDGARENIDAPVDIEITDADGEVLRGLTVTPDSVRVSVLINQQDDFRDVAVKVVVQGQQAPGYRIENISVFPPIITVFSSDPTVVNSLRGVVETQPLDLQDAKEDISTRLSLSLPENVTLVGAQTVQVQVSITPIQTSLTLLNQPINVNGLAEGLSAQTFPQTVDVIVSGPLPVLEVLASQNVKITVNVTGLGLGTYQLKPDVEVLIANVLVESILPGTVEVVLSIPNTPTPTLNP